MTKKRNSSYAKKVALPPGSLVHLGKVSETDVQLSVIIYDTDRFERRLITTPADLGTLARPGAVTWLTLSGCTTPACWSFLGIPTPSCPDSGRHPEYTPAAQGGFYDEYMYFVLKMIRYDKEQKLDSEQVSWCCSGIW